MLKLLEENIGNTLLDVGIEKDFLKNRTPFAQELGPAINKWAPIKLKSLCKTREIISQVQGKPRDWERIFASYTSDRETISRIYKKAEDRRVNERNNPG